MNFLQSLIKRIPAQQRIDLYEFLASLMKNQFDVQKASGEVAKTLEQQAETVWLQRSSLKSAAAVYRHIEAEQRNGRGIHISLEGRIPDAELMMLLAGSEGEPVQGLEAAADMAKSSHQRQIKILKGVAYPSGVLVAVIFAIQWIGENLLSTFADMKDVSTWDSLGQKVFWASTNIEVWTPLLALTLIAIAALTVLINRKVLGDVREAIHWVPPLNIVRSVTGATYLRTLASLIKAGTPIQKALETMRDRTGSEYMRHYLEDAVSKYRAGVAKQGPGKAIGSRLFTPWIMVKLDLHSRGTIEAFTSVLSEIADDAEARAMNTIGSLAKWLNVALMVVAASVVLVSLLTMLSVSTSLQSGVS